MLGSQRQSQIVWSFAIYYRVDLVESLLFIDGQIRGWMRVKGNANESLARSKDNVCNSELAARLQYVVCAGRELASLIGKLTDSHRAYLIVLTLNCSDELV